MTLLETITILFLTTQPFGQIPFSAASLTSDTVEVTLLYEKPVQLVFDRNMDIIEVNHQEITCEHDREV